jgi:hypothetical protein
LSSHHVAARIALAAGLAALVAVLGCAAARSAEAPQVDAPGSPPAAPAETRLTGVDVLSRYVDVTGGRAAHEQLESRIIHGSFEGRVLFFHVSGTFTTWQKHPRKLKTEARAKLLGREIVFIAATDGSSAWQGGGNEVRMLDGARRDSFIRQADLHLVLTPELHYPSIEYRGEEPFNGVTCRRVELRTKEGDTETRFYASETGLLNGMSARKKGAADAFAMRVSDYQDVGGIKEPTRFEFSILGGTVSWQHDAIEHNVEIDDARFTPPKLPAAAATTTR